MTCPHKTPTALTALFDPRQLVAGMLLILLFAAWTNARAAEGRLSETDQQCLNCHGTAGFEKKLANGETLSLQISRRPFTQSVHIAIGCGGCHSDVDLKAHPPAKSRITTTREHSKTLAQVCRTCHSEKFELYETSIHATLARSGNPIAPLCTDCHDPHAVRPIALQTVAEVPCRKCHDSIYNAYLGSVHGKARARGAESGAPICANCHRAHDVSVASTGDQLKNACLGCHQGALDAHKEWLPNAAQHFEVISCPVCHAPGAKRRVDLRLYDNVTQKRVSEKLGVPQFETRAQAIDTKGAGLDALAVRSLLQEFNRNDLSARTVLHGRLEVMDGPEAHQLTDKSKAISNCDTCHREGADVFQQVTISIADANGIPVRYGAQKEVLSSMISVDSIRGFYAIGGTRIKLLDVLLVLTLLTGVGVPIGHLTLKWVFARRRARAQKQDAGHAK